MLPIALHKVFILLNLISGVVIYILISSLLSDTQSARRYSNATSTNLENNNQSLPSNETFIRMPKSIYESLIYNLKSICQNDPIRVVFVGYNWMQVSDNSYETERCSVPCMYTKDTRPTAIKLANAAVIFTPHWAGHPNDLLAKYKVDASRVFTVGMATESIVRFPHQFDHMKEYDVEMSYHMKSDVPFTYYKGQHLLDKANPKWKTREKAVLFIARNCASYNRREELVKQLQKYVRVDSVSDCLHNKEWPSNISRNDKKSILKRYVAVLAAENSIAQDYVTEKVYGGLVTGTVPIYYGAPNIDQFVLSNSIIKVPYPFNNESIRNVSEQIKRILNSEEYNKYTHFKELGYEDKFVKMFNFTRITEKCRWCQKLMSLKCNNTLLSISNHNTIIDTVNFP